MSENSSTPLEERVGVIERKLDALIHLFIAHSQDTEKSRKAVDKNFDLINAKIDKLAKDAKADFKDVGDQLGDIQEELVKIQKVSNYSEEYQNLLTIAK